MLWNEKEKKNTKAKREKKEKWKHVAMLKIDKSVITPVACEILQDLPSAKEVSCHISC